MVRAGGRCVGGGGGVAGAGRSLRRGASGLLDLGRLRFGCMPGITSSSAAGSWFPRGCTVVPQLKIPLSVAPRGVRVCVPEVNHMRLSQSQGNPDRLAGPF